MKTRMTPVCFGVLLSIVLLGVLGCSGEKMGAAMSTPDPVPTQPVMCVVDFDGSGSYAYAEKAKNTAIRYVRGLPGNSKICFRWIIENSYSDRAAILTAVLPPDPPSTSNPFNVRMKAARQRAMGERERFFKELSEALAAVKSPRASRTDVWGALSAAAERFATNPGHRPVLIMLSDLVDNVRRKPATLDLHQAAVMVLDYQVGTSGDSSNQASWVRTLSESGASSVTMRHLDDVPDLKDPGGP